MTLVKKTILITGAARRIGRQIAIAASHRGADIILHYHNSKEDAEATAAAIRGNGRNCWLVRQDLSEEGAPENLIEKALGFSPIHVLINNASIFKPVGFVNTTLDDWNKHLLINLTVPFQLTQLFSKNFHSKEPGRVVNLLDWRALRPGRDHFPYTISKAGLLALTKSTALNLAPRILVNAVALGAILPPENEPENEAIINPVPMKRWSTLEELESTVLFLLDGPEYITGEVIHLDGGRHLV